MTQPLVMIEAPPVADYRYGLFSAAAVVDPADLREFWAGVEFEPVSPSVPASTTAQDAAAAHGPMSVPAGIDSEQGTVIRLYSGVQADIGSNRDDWAARAQTKLARSDQQTLERMVWASAAGNAPQLADAGTATPAGAAAVSLLRAVGELERWIADNVGGLGVVWAPRWASAYLAEATLLRYQDPVVRAPMGNPIVFASTTGAGAGPDGEQPAAGGAWLYATGPVMVRRSPVIGVRQLEQMHDRATNDVFAVAERFYTVSWPSGAAAALAAVEPAQA